MKLRTDKTNPNTKQPENILSNLSILGWWGPLVGTHWNLLVLTNSVWRSGSLRACNSNGRDEHSYSRCRTLTHTSVEPSLELQQGAISNTRQQNGVWSEPSESLGESLAKTNPQRIPTERIPSENESPANPENESRIPSESQNASLRTNP